MNQFKPDSQPSEPKENIEFSFEEGVDKSVEKIQELLKTLNRNIFVVINGSSYNVGKTALQNALRPRLISLGVGVIEKGSAHRPNRYTVFFSTAYGLTWEATGNYASDLRKLNPDAPVGTYGDLYIGIYRPDKKFALPKGKKGEKFKPVADIMICNKHAIDNPDKRGHRI